MSKHLIAILLALSVLSGCRKESDNPENLQLQGLDGWDISKSDYDFDINPRDIYFVNANIGFVVGYNGDIYKTTDSGKTWVKKNSGTTLHLFSVFFISEDVGFVSGQAASYCLDADCDKGAVLLKTTDGGETWVKTFFPDFTRILSLKFRDALKGIAIIHKPDLPNSRDEYAAITSDGGATWNLLDLAIMPYSDRLFQVDNTIFVIGDNRKIFKSSDFGYTWLTINSPIESNYSARNLYFYNENIGYIDGMRSVYKTTDGGLNWTKTIWPFTSLGTFHFYNEKEGFNIEPVMVYDGGDFPTFTGSICYETLNGGESWSKSGLVKSFYLGLTFFPQRNMGYGFNLSEFCTIKRKE